MRRVREGRVSTWSDSLGMAPGVFIQDRFGAEEARIAMRGSGLSRTFHSFGIKLLQDGIPLNYADGFFDMQSVDTAAASHVEVLRGANALKYGATTLGGAINFLSPTGRDAMGVTARAEAGSFGYQRMQVLTGGANEATDGPATDYFLSASASRQEGFRDHARQESQKLTGNLGFRFSPSVESRLFFGATRSCSQLPGYLSLDELRANPSQASSEMLAGRFPFREEANRRRDVDAFRLANTLTVLDGDWFYELSGYLMQHQLWHPINVIVMQDTVSYGLALRATHHGRFAGMDQQWTLAYLPSRGTTAGTSRPTDHRGNPIGPASSDYQQTAVNHSLFAEQRLRIAPALTLVASLQFDSAGRRVSDRLLASNNLDHRFSQWSPRIGVIYQPEPTLQVYANLSRNFEAPVFGLVGSTTTANRAQTGTTLELGSRGERQFASHRWSWDLTLYRSALSNEFQTMCPPSNPGCTSGATTVNVPHTIHQGVELGIGGWFAGMVEGRVTALYSDFRFDGNPQYGNQRLPGFPPLIVRGELLYRWGSPGGHGGLPASYAGPRFEWVPQRAAMDNANTLFNDPYALLGFKAGQAIDSHWSWFLDARNLLDKRYAGTTNIASNYAGATAPLRVYYPGDGRSVYLGVERKW